MHASGIKKSFPDFYFKITYKYRTSSDKYTPIPGPCLISKL